MTGVEYMVAIHKGQEGDMKNTVAKPLHWRWHGITLPKGGLWQVKDVYSEPQSNL